MRGNPRKLRPGPKVAEGLEASRQERRFWKSFTASPKLYFCWILFRYSVTFLRRTYPRS